MDSSTTGAAEEVPWPLVPEDGLGALHAEDDPTGLLAFLQNRSDTPRTDVSIQQFAQREFLGVVSHEIKTSLAIVNANLQLAERRLVTPESDARTDEDGGAARAMETARALLITSQHCVTRLDRLIDDLLDVSRARAGMFELYPEACDLSPLVRHAVAEHRLTYPAQPIEFRLPAGRAVPVFVDVRRIRQVLANYLAATAAHASEVHPVGVSVKVEGGAVCVFVRSADPGLPADEQERIWEIFHRPEGVELQSASATGVGLGLHISRNIVERHGGHVGIEISGGQGSTLWFTLPVLPTAQ